MQRIENMQLPAAKHQRPQTPWAFIEEKYDIQKREGEGGYGEVFKAIDRSTEKTVAIKAVKSLFTDINTTRTAVAEL